MNEIVSSYSAFSVSVVAAAQKLGLLTIPIVLVLAALVNYFGGEKAIRAVGLAIAVVAILTLILNNTMALSTWIGTGFPGTAVKPPTGG